MESLAKDTLSKRINILEYTLSFLQKLKEQHLLLSV